MANSTFFSRVCVCDTLNSIGFRFSFHWLSFSSSLSTNRMLSNEWKIWIHKAILLLLSNVHSSFHFLSAQPSTTYTHSYVPSQCTLHTHITPNARRHFRYIRNWDSFVIQDTWDQYQPFEIEACSPRTPEELPLWTKCTSLQRSSNKRNDFSLKRVWVDKRILRLKFSHVNVPLSPTHMWQKWPKKEIS